jgi:phosphate transport system permease protein
MIRRIPNWIFPRLTGAVAWALAGLVLSLILGISWMAWPYLSWAAWVGPGGRASNPLDPRSVCLAPLLIGTAARTFLMSLAVIPMGILTAVYLAEYAPSGSRMARTLRWLVQVLAGVPSVIFGLFGLGFFVGVVGGGLDRWNGDLASPVWGRPALLWASLTMALMTVPVVVVATEEALRSVPRDLRVAAIALGATRLQVLMRILLPNALPGIATGVILAIGRASGEVVPLLFTGAAVATQGSVALNERFMDLAYQVFVLSTQSPDPQASRPLLLTSVWALVFLSLLLNAGAAILRSRATPAARDRL